MDARTIQLLHIPLVLLVLIVMLLHSMPLAVQGIVPSVDTDMAALLMFKKIIQKGAGGILSSWNPNSNPCLWYGVTCSLGRVTHLSLSGSNLHGPIYLDPLASLTALVSLKLSSSNFIINSTTLIQLPHSLKRLELSSSGLVGAFPDIFLKRPELIYVDLSCNNLSGLLPDDLLSNPNKFQTLNLSYNNFTGQISGWTITNSSCCHLAHLDLSGNHLVDNIPSCIGKCVNLKTLNLSFNMLTGDIPKSLGELSRLERLDLSSNHLSDWIPSDIGNACGSLLEMKLSSNNLSGSIPISFSMCTKLKLLDLSSNNLSGTFPDSILRSMESLEQLLLSNNLISGTFPSSVSFCKNLRIIDLSSNRFSGHIPLDICPGTYSLEELRMPDNLLEGEIPAQLSKCSKLKTIDFSINYLKGSIPADLGKLASLQQLLAWYNQLEGEIPPELGACGKLKNLILNNNQLTGVIPIELFNCSNLEWIALTSNKLSGIVSAEVGHLQRLTVLQLANNNLSGEIPMELGKCSSLVWLDLGSNNFRGEIPSKLGRPLGAKAFSGVLSGNTLVFVRNVGNSCKGAGGLLEFAGIKPERLLQVPTLKSCDFTRLYSGPVLSMFTRYQTLEYLDLSYNELHGKIPEEFGDMTALQVLELAHNGLSGEIPATLGQLKNLGVFDVSHNRLHGQIPESFSSLSFLVQIDLSNNQLTGQIPQRGQLSTLPASQYEDNPGLCGVPLPECRSESTQVDTKTVGSRDIVVHNSSATSWSNSIVLGILISVASICILMVWAIAVRVRQKEVKDVKMLNSLQGIHAPTTWKIEKEKEPLSINVATFQRQLKRLKFSQLIEATNGFSAQSLIGCGGFGEVFKATLKDGSSVAIKKLIRLSCQGDREFVAEMETLGKIKHKNLVPLLGYCKVGEERLLVYEFMEFGSLEDMLHGRFRPKEKRILTWEDRKKIARGAAKGLCFLHHNCIPHIIHRDMKSSNVLLDHDMEARVSDFGMARLISALDTHLSVSTLAGTPGYVPPEYYQSFRCTAKGDVYSLGVVLLELLTGKQPTDKEDFGDTNLVGWVKMKTRDGTPMEVIDPELLPLSDGTNETDPDEVKEMIRYLEITLKCVDDFSSKRPNMLEVVAMLRELTPQASSSSQSG